MDLSISGRDEIWFLRVPSCSARAIPSIWRKLFLQFKNQHDVTFQKPRGCDKIAVRSSYFVNGPYLRRGFTHTNTRAATRQLRSRICVLTDIVWSKGWWRSCLIEILASPYNILIIIEQAIKLIRSCNCPVRRKEKNRWVMWTRYVSWGGGQRLGGPCIRVHITCWVVRLPGSKLSFFVYVFQAIKCECLRRFRATVDAEPSPRNSAFATVRWKASFTTVTTELRLVILLHATYIHVAFL